jgi:hypothetical protein
MEASSSTRRRSLVTLPLFMGALLPFGLSMYFHTHGPAAQPVAKGAERSPLVFGQYMVDLGLAPAGGKLVRAWYAFMNKGTRPLTVKDIVASCQCIHPQYMDDKRVYAPGEKGRIDVFIDTTKETSGEKEFLLRVPYESGAKTGEEELTFRVTLPEPQVALLPRSLIFYQFNEQEQTQLVSIVDNRPAPLTFQSLEQTSELARPLAEATLVGTTDADNRRTITISVKVPGKVPERRIRESIIVKTDDSEFGTIRIPLWIDGRKITLSHPEKKAE